MRAATGASESGPNWPALFWGARGGAGAARLRQVGATSGAGVAVVRRESGFRLPAATEVRLYRLLLDVLVDAQRHRAHHVEVELIVAAPHFQFTISHSGATSLSVAALRERLDDIACQLSVGERRPEKGGGCLLYTSPSPRDS